MWQIQYFNQRVQRDIEAWPVGIYADFLRMIQMMEDHGADLKMLLSRAMGGDFLSFDATALRALVVLFIA